MCLHWAFVISLELVKQERSTHPYGWGNGKINSEFILRNNHSWTQHPPGIFCWVLGISVDSILVSPFSNLGLQSSSWVNAASVLCPFFRIGSSKCHSHIPLSSIGCLLWVLYPDQLSVTIFYLRSIDHLLSRSYISTSNHLYHFVSWKRIHHCLSLTNLFSSTSTHHPRIRLRNPKQYTRPACPNGKYICHRK